MATNGANMFDFLKASTLTSGMAGMSGAAGGAGGAGPTAAFTSFLYITVIQFIFELVKQLTLFVQGVAQEWWKRNMNRAKKNVTDLVNEKMAVTDEASLFEHKYQRRYGANVPSAAYVMADAVLWHVSNIPTVHKLLKTGDLTVLNSDERVRVADDIFFQQIDLNFDADGAMTDISFRLWTEGDAKGGAALAAYEQRIREEFLANRQNSLGSRRYFFDQYVEEVRQLDREGKPRTITGPLRFTKNEFVTGRTLNNMFFHEKNKVLDRFRFFLNNRAWYDAKGIPYSLGFLLYGTPGCGKTSTIKAIANESGRHIVNVNMSKITSKSMFKRLFYEPVLDITKPDSLNQTTEAVYVPVHKRVFVFEDADAVLSSVLLKRESDEPTDTADAPPALAADAPPAPATDAREVAAPSRNRAPGIPDYDYTPVRMDSPMAGSISFSAFSPPRSRAMPAAPPKQPSGGKQPSGKRASGGSAPAAEDPDALDLATVLNILDGILEQPGRIIIMTSNHPEQFDSALLRPGRLDVIIKFEKCNADMLVQMARLYYDDAKGTGLTEEELWAAARAVPDRKWSPAEVTSLLQQHFFDREAVWAALRDDTPRSCMFDKK